MNGLPNKNITVGVVRLTKCTNITCPQFLYVILVTHSKLHTYKPRLSFCHDCSAPYFIPTHLAASLTTTHYFRVCLLW